MDKLVQELLDAAIVVVGNVTRSCPNSMAVPNDIVGLCLAISHIEDSEKNVEESNCLRCVEADDCRDANDSTTYCDRFEPVQEKTMEWKDVWCDICSCSRHNTADCTEVHMDEERGV